MFDTAGIKSQLNIIKNALPKVSKETTTREPIGPGLGTREIAGTAEGFNTQLPGIKQIVELIEGIEAMPQVVNAAEMQMLSKIFT